MAYVFLKEPWTEDATSRPQSDPSLKEHSQILRKLPPPKPPTSQKSFCECCWPKNPEIPCNLFPPIMDKLLVAVFVLVLLFGVAYSSDNAGDGPGDETKKRNLHTNQRGNHHSCDQNRQRKRAKKSREAQPSPQLTSLEILKNQQKACQSKGCEKYFLNFFCKTDCSSDFFLDDAVDTFNDLRKDTLGLSKETIDQECLSLFLSVHQEQFNNKVGSEKWKPDPDRLFLTIKGYEMPVCTQTFVEAHGFTMSRWKKMAKVARIMSNTGKVGTFSQVAKGGEKHKEYKEETILDFTLAEAEMIFKQHVPDFLKEMPRMSLTPKKEADFLCVAWLFRYSIKFILYFIKFIV